MAKKILFIINETEVKYFEFNKLVTDFWLIKEFLERDEKVYITTPKRLGLKQAKPYCLCAETYIEDENIFYKEQFDKTSVEEFDIVMFRPDPPVDINFINATYILDFVDRTKTVIINDTKAIRDFNEKLHANLFVELMPENIVTSDKHEILEFLSSSKEIILKPLNQCFGSGVMYLKQGDKNTTAVINTMTNNGTNVVMVQKYIAAAARGDKRVMILNGEVYDECVIKLPPKDDFKFNTHSNQFVKKGVLSKSEKEKFTPVAQKLNLMGLTMAGLDVIDEKIIEVNITSPCYFIKEIDEYFETDLESRIVDDIYDYADKHSKACMCAM